MSWHLYTPLCGLCCIYLTIPTQLLKREALAKWGLEKLRTSGYDVTIAVPRVHVRRQIAQVIPASSSSSSSCSIYRSIKARSSTGSTSALNTQPRHSFPLPSLPPPCISLPLCLLGRVAEAQPKGRMTRDMLLLLSSCGYIHMTKLT